MTQSFSDLGVSEVVSKALLADGIQSPFAIQRLVIGDVLAGRRQVHRAAEHRRRDLLHRGGLRPASDEQDPVDVRTLGDERVEAVCQAAQQPLHQGPRQVRRGGRRGAQPVHGPGGVGPVRRALAVEVGHHDQAVCSRGGGQGQPRQPREVRDLLAGDLGHAGPVGSGRSGTYEV